MGDLKNKLETQKAETAQAESKLKAALEDLEKMKSAGDAEKTAWETEKTALVNRAEAAESQLKPVAEELSGLKHHITQMSAAIFGKFFRYRNQSCPSKTPLYAWRLKLSDLIVHHCFA